MKNTKILLAALGSFLLAAPVTAQTIYDVSNVSAKDLNGTARFVGMGGAMNALGGDISTISTNPAGIGIYRSNDLVLSFGLSAYGSKNSTPDGTYKKNNTRGDFNNLGLVYSAKVGNATALRYMNLGFNYQRGKSFYRNYKFSGGLGETTQTVQMAQQAAGIYEDAWDDAFNNSEIGWLSAMGWYGGLIDPDGMGNQSYMGAYYGGSANLSVEEGGGIDQYDLNMSFNINDRVYLGFSVGIYDVYYKKHSYYLEDYLGANIGEGYDLESWNKLVGTGMDLKVGAIIRPFADSPFRFGIAAHTPTFYTLDYKTSAKLTSTMLSMDDGNLYDYSVNTWQETAAGGDMIRHFRLTSPWLFNLSVGTTVGAKLALDAEYELQDYATVKFRDEGGYSDYFSYENSTCPMLKTVSTFRVGAEFKPTPALALRAGYNYRTALLSDKAYKDLPYYSIQTDTDCLNTGDSHTATVGVGYHGNSGFYADLAVKYQTMPSTLYPFTYSGDGGGLLPSTAMATKVTNSRTQAILTLGYRF